MVQNKKYRCIFMASDPIALPAIEWIASNESPVQLVATYTQPDRPTGRGKKLQPNAIKKWSKAAGVPVEQPHKIDSAAIDTFNTLEADIVLVMAYGHILPQSILDLPPFGFYNLHASLLPKLRGASPIETAILEGETETGVTLMQVVKALDAGDMVGSVARKIGAKQTNMELRAELADSCVPLLQQSLPGLLDRTAKHTPQDNAKTTYCRLINKADGFLDFNLTSEQILNHIRGFQPWPGALFKFDNIVYKVGSAQASQTDLETTSPGNMLADKHSIHIACTDGWIEVLTIQKPGGKMLSTPEFLNGTHFPPSSHITFPQRFPLSKPKYFKKPID